jgi:glycine dehydrogenase subunit 1
MEVDYGDGVTLLPAMEKLVRETTAAVIIQNPNFFGCVEDIQVLGAIAKQQGALFIVLADPVSLGVLEAPGRLGADIVVGEGQGMGLPVSFGGPYLGFFATTEKLMRKMPGRIVGQTTDDRGNRGFVLTLQAREQHIRRGKATSNICSNEALCALAAAVYLSVVGKVGFQQVAQLSLQKAHYAYEKLTRIQGYSQVFSAPFFKEFVLKCSKPIQAINQQLLAKKIIGGLDLGTYYPELAGCMLVCVTEKRTLQQIHQLVSALEEII